MVTGGTLGGIKRPSGKGKHLIILGAGGEMGWIPNTTLIFQSKKNTGDYHDEMTGEHFEEWFRDKLLPNVPPNSLIVMDNASYHSRLCEEVPVSSWWKLAFHQLLLIEWLVFHELPFYSDAKKSELLAIVHSIDITRTYVIDEMVKAGGQEVVRLPVAHCTLNPIELAWSQVKGHIKSNAHEFNLSECERLAWEGFDIVTHERWTDLVRHVRDKVEDHYWKVDGLTHHRVISEFTIRLGSRPNDSHASDTSDDDSSPSDSDSIILDCMDVDND